MLMNGDVEDGTQTFPSTSLIISKPFSPSVLENTQSVASEFIFYLDQTSQMFYRP